MTKPFLSMVVPTLTTGRTPIARLLTALARQRVSFPFEVIVVANPRAPSLPATFGTLRWRLEVSGEVGVNAARNRGVVAARGEWLYFVDDDCLPADEGHLERVRQVLDVRGPRDLVGGPYLPAAEAGAYSRAYDLLQGRWLREGRHSEYGWIHLLGGNLLVHASAFEKLGFDSSIAFGGAETELVMRLLRGGCRGFYAESIGLRHEHRLGRADFLRKAFLQGYGHQRLRDSGTFIEPSRRSFWREDEARAASGALALYDRAFRVGRAHRVGGLPRPGPWRLEWELLRTYL